MRVRYATVFSLCALLSAFYAVTLNAWWAQLLLANVTVCFIGVSLAYARLNGRVFRKRSDGRLPLSSVLCFWPFLMLANVANRCVIRLRRIRSADEIVPGLWLGRHCSEREALGLVQRIGTRTVVDLEAEAGEAPAFRRVPGYRLVPVLDRVPVSEQQMRAALQAIDAGLVKGPVLVHCALGRGRSVMVVMAYLMMTGEASSVDEALCFVQARRRGVGLHADQLRVLERFRGGLVASQSAP